MANQKKSEQAKKVEAMGKKTGATKAQVAQGLARAGGKSTYNVTKQDVKKAGQAAKIIAGAAVTAAGPGKVVKAAKAVSKGANAVKFAAQRANFSRGTVKVEPMLKKKTSSEKIAKNNVKVVKPTDSMVRASKNIKSNAKVQEAKIGQTAKRDAANVDVSKGYMGAGLPKKAFTIGDNVKVKVPTTPSGKQTLNRGTVQVIRENIRATSKTTKAEAKANARGLKAANKKK